MGSYLWCVRRLDGSGDIPFPGELYDECLRARQLVFYNRPYGLSLCHGANGVPVVVGALNGLIELEPVFDEDE